ncbi:hypothetical protein JCM21531_3988 [Acetivibrio straminisolvens JCM 21531]|uniref:Uncharacterized protein n=2 Tax=Acetivibrio straminisolvens TaxID=253314 RepID=W4VB20_9FIRM|nr:hypothetical protein JCM21531_3988 [Acetivibrio straminisolvens JCM 21531]
MVVGGYEFPWHDEGKLTELLWLNVSSLASNCLDNNFDVVIDYIVFPEHLKYIEKLKCKYNIVLKYVVLMANEDTIRMRDRKRPRKRLWGTGL